MIFKPETIQWFKQKLTEAVANAIIYGLGIIVLWAVYVSISGERQMRDISETLNAQMTKFFNEGVERDKQLNERIGQIERTLGRGGPGGDALPAPAPAPQGDYYERYRRDYVPIPQQQMAPQELRR